MSIKTGKIRNKFELAVDQTVKSEFFEPIFRSRIRKFALLILGFYVLMAIIGPVIAPNDQFETQYTSDGSVARLQSPSLEYPMGTTSYGYDILSQILHSFRISVIIAAGASLLIVFLGMNIGLISGYYGGKVDTVVMAFTDIIYGLPLIPFAIVYVSLMGRTDLNIIIVIGILIWRSIARVTRSEVLSIKEREFVKGARAAGSSDIKIMYFHILPNIIPIIVVYFLFGAVWGVMIEASLSFLGLGNPDSVSWGLMLRQVYDQGMFTEALWWVFFPSFALWLFIICLYVISRAFEENTNKTFVKN